MNTGGEDYDIFLSHSTRLAPEHHELLDALVGALTRRGLRVFHDRRDLPRGAPLVPSLSGAIHRSSVGLVFSSPEAAKSGWVAFELREMRDRQQAGAMVILAVRAGSGSALPAGVDPGATLALESLAEVGKLADQLLARVGGSARRSRRRR